jgi:hypothetical protein
MRVDMSMAEKPKTQASQANMPPPEKQQLVAGVFASKTAADAAMEKIKGWSPASDGERQNILVLSKDDKGKVEISIIDIGSTSGVNIAVLAKRIAADLTAVAGKPGAAHRAERPGDPPGSCSQPGAVAVGLFVDPQSAGKIEDGIGKMAPRSSPPTTSAHRRRLGAAQVRMTEVKAAAAPQAAAPAVPAVFDWQAENAYSLALQAFIYGFPYVYNAQTRYKWTNIPQNPKFVPYAPVNHFWHSSQVMDATYRDGGCPNNDTLYSLAWVDLSIEPVILTVPEISPERYWTFELMGFTSDNFAYVCQRVGSKAGN